MNSGWPPTAPNARAGLFTPPGISRQARSNAARLRGRCVVGGLSFIDIPLSPRIPLGLPQPATEVDAERAIDRLVGAQEVVIHPHAVAAVPELAAERPEPLQVLGAQPGRIDQALVRLGFQVLELRQPAEREFDLLGGQDVEQ